MLSRLGGRPTAWVMLIAGLGVLGALGVLHGRGPAADAGAVPPPDAISSRTIPAPLPGESATGGAPIGELTITDPPSGAPAGPARAAVGPGGVPGVPLVAYRRAEHLLASTTPGCRLRWSLLAAIGRAETGHANGGRVDAAGRTLGRILGPRLDGTNGRPRVPDTDGGALDGDRNWDRAVGPMQLLPSVWRRYATAEDGRTAPDPDNVFDAALAAGRFLCAGGADLVLPDRRAAAIRRYRDSRSYLAAVRAWSIGYAEGSSSVPLVMPAPQRSSPPPLAAVPPPTRHSPAAAPKPSPTSRPPAAVPKPPRSPVAVPELPSPTSRPPSTVRKPPPSRPPDAPQAAPAPRTTRPPTALPPDRRSSRPTATSSPPQAEPKAEPRPELEGESSAPRATRTAPTTPDTDMAGPIIVVEPSTPSTSPRPTESPGPTGMVAPPTSGSRRPTAGGGPSGSATPTPSSGHPTG